MYRIFVHAQTFCASVEVRKKLLQVGLTPMGWNLGWNEQNICSFVFVIDFRYRVYFNFFGFILTPLIIMALIYIYIFTVVKAQIKEIASLQVSVVFSAVFSSACFFALYSCETELLPHERAFSGKRRCYNLFLSRSCKTCNIFIFVHVLPTGEQFCWRSAVEFCEEGAQSSEEICPCHRPVRIFLGT